jgi:hypothetical protein
MTRLTADEFVRGLKAEGVKVVKESRGGKGWPNNTTAGSFNGHGVLNHHDARNKKTTIRRAVDTVWYGRSDLDGPLAHISLDPKGVAHLVGWDNCNHAGKGDKDVLSAVLRDVPAPKPDFDSVDGNPHFWAIEVQNNGLGEPYPLVQLEALIKINTAICRMSNWKATSCIHHREWTRRKIDMSWHGDLRGHITSALSMKAGAWHFPGIHLDRPVKAKPSVAKHVRGPNAVKALVYVARGLKYATSAKKPGQAARWKKIQALLEEF